MTTECSHVLCCICRWVFGGGVKVHALPTELPHFSSDAIQVEESLQLSGTTAEISQRVMYH